MKINTNSNVYTLVYASVVVVIVAFLLAFVSKSLEPASMSNERIDKRSKFSPRSTFVISTITKWKANTRNM